MVDAAARMIIACVAFRRAGDHSNSTRPTVAPASGSTGGLVSKACLISRHMGDLGHGQGGKGRLFKGGIHHDHRTVCESRTTMVHMTLLAVRMLCSCKNGRGGCHACCLSVLLRSNRGVFGVEALRCVPTCCGHQVGPSHGCVSLDHVWTATRIYGLECSSHLVTRARTSRHSIPDSYRLCETPCMWSVEKLCRTLCGTRLRRDDDRAVRLANSNRAAHIT